MKNLNSFLHQAAEEHWAVGHFNVSNLEQLKAAAAAASKLRSPVMVGTSEGERNWIGLKQAVALVKSFQEDWRPIFLNADHTATVAAAKKAIEAGYDSIHFDGSGLTNHENIWQTRAVVEYARGFNTSISVEGELGYLRGQSQVLKTVIKLQDADYTDPEEAGKFVDETGIDRLAIAVGNIHGLTLAEPKLDFERIKAVRQAVPVHVALVLHAGSGIPDSDIKKAIEAGISNIHISTELRVVFRQGLWKSLQENLQEYAPYKLLKGTVGEMESLVSQKIRLFGSVNKY